MEELVENYLIAYQKFFQVDIVTSLLYGREYEILYSLLISLNDDILLDEKDLRESKKSVLFLEENIDIYKNKIIEIFTVIDKKKFEINNIDFKTKGFYLFLETIDEIWDEFLEAYNKLSIYKNANIHEVLLIEFNNSLSHIISYYTQGDETNLKRAKEHLYRATLDGYKEIINDENHIIIANKELMYSYLDVRLFEQENIGNKNNINKLDIINKYKNIANNILTLLNLDK